MKNNMNNFRKLIHVLPKYPYSNMYIATSKRNATVLAKTRHVCTKTEFNFIAAVYRHTQYLSIPSVSSAKC